MPANSKDLTVLICTRNGARTIQRAVELCLRELEACADVAGELIVVDNGSTDETVAIVEAVLRTSKAPGRLLHAERPGKNHAIEKGVRSAQGEIVCIIDDDNFIEPTFFTRTLRFFTDYPAVGMVGANKRLDPSLQAPNWFEWAADHLACVPPSLQEGVVIDCENRQVGALGYIAGAGMSFRRIALLRALDAGYSFFNDTVRGKTITGEDIELCFLIRSMGFSFGYDPGISLTHCLAPTRLTHEAFWRLCENIGAGALGIDPFIFTTKQPPGRLKIKYSWQWQLLTKLRQFIGSQFVTPENVVSSEHIAFRRKRDRHQLWGAIRRITTERGRYTDHIRNVASGPWTRLRVK